MPKRTVRPPSTQLEQCAHDVARGSVSPTAKASFAALAKNAGLTEAQVADAVDPSQGVGTIDSRVVVLELPIEQARALLPLGLELAPQPLTFPDKHPVFVMFSHDDFNAWFGDMDYNELMVGVPYVQLTATHVANRGPFVYMPRLYLDSETPKILGNLLYGFEKELGIFSNEAASYSVSTEDGELIAEARFTEDGAAQPPSAIPNFDTVRQIFDMPTVSQALRIVDADAFDDRDLLSPFLCSTITYDFSDDKATVQPLSASVRFTEALTPAGLPTDPLQVPSLATSVLGAFRMKAPQVVSLPGSCSDTTYCTPSPPRKKRVVVLGGGPSSLATAYYLARQQDRYEVELYTAGWRLGGKCAAGRNPNADNRIEEHGLHAFVGFYENGFRAMRDVYKDAGIPIAKGEEPYDYAKGEGPVAGGFEGCEDVGVFQKWQGEWRYFSTPQTFNGKIPGTVPEGGEDPHANFGAVFGGALRRVVKDTGALLSHNVHDRTPSDDDDDDDATLARRARFEAEKDESLWSRLVDDFKSVVDFERRGLMDGLDHLVSYIERAALESIAQDIEEGSTFFRGLAALLGAIRGALKKVLADEIENDPDISFVWQGVDVLLTAFIGVIHAKTVNFDTLDDFDFREWLLSNGMDERNTEAAAVTQVYETLFAHADDRPYPDKMAAGVGLRWFLMVAFLYKGYPAYFFRYSCPQTMCTPYYMALQNLGAKIHFFHEVLDLEVEGQRDDRRLSGIKMRVQATTVGDKPYDPFVHGLPNNPVNQPPWPTEPKFDQLIQSDELRTRGIDLENPWSGWEGVCEKTLRIEEDFDLCVLGIPLSVFPAIARQLTDASKPTYAPAWKEMVDGIAVTQTVSTQLWFQKPMPELARTRYGMLTSFAQPEPSMGDFTHLLEWENWDNAPHPALALAYHTGSLTSISVAQGYPDASPDYPKTETARWREMFAGWLRERYSSIYDRVVNFDVMLDTLATPKPAEGIDRLWQQYFNIAVHPSDLYILSQPKAMSLRLGQSESWVRDLFLCGDWTKTDMNCGCVEASTQSGMLASRAISNYPRYIWHPGF